MFSGLPDRVDPLRLADAGRVLAGSVALGRFPRLGEDLVEASGEVTFELAFGRHPLGFAVVTGRLSTVVGLRCQRCLEGFALPLESGVALGFVESEALAERLPPEYDPCVVVDGTVSVPDIIEDELLLALPQVPLHPAGACAVRLESAPDAGSDKGATEQDSTDRENPFAVLKHIKTED